MPLKAHSDSQAEIDRLDLMATRIRRMALKNITRSKVGHPGGSLSVADILATLYFGRAYDVDSDQWEPILRYDPDEPLWPERDRVVLSKGHAAPALYATLALAGFFSENLLKIYRKIDSPLEGHPAMYRKFTRSGRSVEQGTRGVDFSTGSLGHGLSAGAGMALHAKVYGYDYNVFAILGDGDLQEGMTWEACLTIPNKKLNNVFGFIDYNRLQVDGSVDDINCLDPLEDKFKAFNWEVRTIDGHDYSAIVDVLAYFKSSRTKTDKPLMVIGRTVKGKGVSEIENVCKYHALPLTDDAFERVEADCLSRIDMLEKKIDGRPPAAAEIGVPTVSGSEIEMQDLSEVIRSNPAGPYTEATPTRIGYSNALARLGEYEKLFVLNADLQLAVGIAQFCEKYPEDAPDPRNRRSINVGVQEANMMTMGAGIASCGKIPVVNSFGIFSTGRAWEMVRQDIAYPQLNVKIIGSHSGSALGEYGVSHQAIEDVGCMRVLPNLMVVEPSDAVQADYLFEQSVIHEGPVYFRVGRNPVALIYAENNPFGIVPRQEFQLGVGYTLKDGEDITFICSGPIVCEALMVAQSVSESVRVIDMPTIRPIDERIIEKAARETGYICTVQDHFENGGLKDEVLNVIAAKRLDVRFDYIALSGFAESGSAADVFDKYGLSARRIIEKLKLTAN